MRGGDFRISFLFPPPSYIPPREEKKVSAGFCSVVTFAWKNKMADRPKSRKGEGREKPQIKK